MSNDPNVTPPVLTGEGLKAPIIENVAFSLHDLFRESIKDAQPVIQGRTFRNCRIEGPALLLALGGVDFDGCDLGFAGGDVRNLLFRPVGQRAIGAIPVRECLFQRCLFFSVGYTGAPEFIDQVIAALGQPGAASQ